MYFHIFYKICDYNFFVNKASLFVGRYWPKEEHVVITEGDATVRDFRLLSSGLNDWSLSHDYDINENLDTKDVSGDELDSAIDDIVESSPIATQSTVSVMLQ